MADWDETEDAQREDVPRLRNNHTHHLRTLKIVRPEGGAAEVIPLTCQRTGLSADHDKIRP